jgi:hypothetical protein
MRQDEYVPRDFIFPFHRPGGTRSKRVANRTRYYFWRGDVMVASTNSVAIGEARRCRQVYAISPMHRLSELLSRQVFRPHARLQA